MLTASDRIANLEARYGVSAVSHERELDPLARALAAKRRMWAAYAVMEQFGFGRNGDGLMDTPPVYLEAEAAWERAKAEHEKFVRMAWADPALGRAMDENARAA